VSSKGKASSITLASPLLDHPGVLAGHVWIEAAPTRVQEHYCRTWQTIKPDIESTKVDFVPLVAVT
jgi:hypothetical protein